MGICFRATYSHYLARNLATIQWQRSNMRACGAQRAGQAGEYFVLKTAAETKTTTERRTPRTAARPMRLVFKKTARVGARWPHVSVVGRGTSHLVGTANATTHEARGLRRIAFSFQKNFSRPIRLFSSDLDLDFSNRIMEFSNILFPWRSLAQTSG